MITLTTNPILSEHSCFVSPNRASVLAPGRRLGGDAQAVQVQAAGKLTTYTSGINVTKKI